MESLREALPNPIRDYFNTLGCTKRRLKPVETGYSVNYNTINLGKQFLVKKKCLKEYNKFFRLRSFQDKLF